MTIKPEVLAAIERMCTPLDESVLKGATATADAWCMELIRTELLAMDAEIARMELASHQHFMRALENGQAAKIAESRLAAADALLRLVAHEGCSMTPTHLAIQAHLRSHAHD